MMTHHHLAFQRTNGFKRNAYYDKDRRTAEGKSLYTAEILENDRENCYEAEEDGADKRNLRQRVVDKIRRGLSRSVAGDSAVVLLEIVGDLNGVILNSHIEVVEADYQEEIKHRVKPARSAEQSYEALPEIVTACTVDADSEEKADGRRKRHD